MTVCSKVTECFEHTSIVDDAVVKDPLCVMEELPSGTILLTFYPLYTAT